jgi:hypothetical protein
LSDVNTRKDGNQRRLAGHRPSAGVPLHLLLGEKRVKRFGHFRGSLRQAFWMILVDDAAQAEVPGRERQVRFTGRDLADPVSQTPAGFG